MSELRYSSDRVGSNTRAMNRAARAAQQARTATKAARISALAAPLSRLAPQVYNVPNPALRVFTTSFYWGAHFGAWLAHRNNAKKNAPLPPPLFVPPSQPTISTNGWTFSGGGCQTVGGINAVATGSTACNGLRQATAQRWRDNEGVIRSQQSGSITVYTMTTYRQFDRFQWNGSHTAEYAYYYGSGTWRLTQDSSLPEPDPYVRGRSAALLPPPELSWQPIETGINAWFAPHSRPIGITYPEVPFAPSIRQLPDALKFNNASTPPHIQRYHGYSPPRPNVSGGFEPTPTPAPNQVEVHQPTIELGGSGVQVGGAVGMNVRLSPNKFHNNKPPDKNTREVKAKYTAALKKFNSASDVITTGMEWIDIMYSNLPPELKLRYGNTRWIKREVTPQEQLWAVFTNFDKVNWKKTGDDIAFSEVFEDVAIGAVSRRIRDNLNNMGVNPTYFSSAQRGQRFLEKQERYRRKQEEYANRQKEQSRSPTPLWWQ